MPQKKIQLAGQIQRPNRVTENVRIIADDVLSRSDSRVKAEIEDRSSADPTAGTPTLDADLSLRVSPGVYYQFEADLWVRSASAVPDFKWTFVTPAGTLRSFYGWSAVDGAGGTNADAGSHADTFTTALSANENTNIVMTGFFYYTGSGADTLDFSWSQDSSNATPTRLYYGSYMRLTELDPLDP